jgi:hypothetical protein
MHDIHGGSALIGFILGIICILSMQANYFLNNNRHLFEWSKVLIGWQIVYEPRDKRKWYKTKKVWKIVRRKQL